MKCCFHEKKNNKVNSGDYDYNTFNDEENHEAYQWAI